VRRAAACAVLAVVLGAAAAAAPAHAVTLRRVPAGFRQPVYVAAPRCDRHRLFVVERRGTIRVLRDYRTGPRPFLDMRRRVLIRSRDETVDQRGLLSMAFAPDYARSGRFYVFYVDRRDRIRVDELRRSRRHPDRADPSTRRTVLSLGPATTMHHGGQLQFGPDGLLYVSTGMGMTPATSQDPATLGGKILRLDPRRRHPRPEVYALGLRNPWRFSFHRRSLLIGDVGDSTMEEIDVLGPHGAGANFGWPLFEGTRRVAAGSVPHYVAPALVHAHADGWCAIVGGYVVGRRYVYGDVCSGALWSARLRGGRLRDDRPLRTAVPYLVSFGEDGRHRLYAVGLNGLVERIDRLPA
jgi:glucose/arabinose dehydrogenase